MKKFLSFAICLILLPIIFFSGCSNNSSISVLDLSYYFESSVHYRNLSTTATTVSSEPTIDLSRLTSNSYDSDKFDSFTRFTLTGDSEKLYHIYVEKITFYVVTSTTETVSLIINLNITNTRDEDQVGENLSDDELYFEDSVDIEVSPGTEVLYTFNVDKVFSSVSATTYIVFDILNSDVFIADENFKWQIFGLKIYAEARAYNS